MGERNEKKKKNFGRKRHHLPILNIEAHSIYGSHIWMFNKQLGHHQIFRVIGIFTLFSDEKFNYVCFALQVGICYLDFPQMFNQKTILIQINERN